MNANMLSGLGADLKAVIGTVPLNAAAATVEAANATTGVDRTGFSHALLIAGTGVTEGAPDSFTVATKLQHCDTINGTYVDFTPTQGTAALDTITAASKLARKLIDLRGCKQFIVAEQTVAFVNGTSPKVNRHSLILLMGADTTPAQTDGTSP